MLQSILDWSEVWASLIALVIGGAVFKPQHKARRLILLYLAVAVILNLIADINWKFKTYMPSWFQDNNILYNIHSVFRASLFGILFLSHPYLKKKIILRLLLALYFVFVIINFSFFDSLLHFSSLIFSGESILLLIYCIVFSIELIKDDAGAKDAVFWTSLGLFVFESTNFFIFLFYSKLMNIEAKFAAKIWDIHNGAYILLCIFLLRALYEPRKQ